jgi:glycosyltransferase involved in cell wall biosynthesis
VSSIEPAGDAASIDSKARHGHEAPPLLSVVIPVFNSAGVIAETVARTCTALEALGGGFEIILVNDGSRDDSWQVIAGLARLDGRLTAIDLLKNSGQHAANLCGFRAARGEWVVTMDDDLQNPPEEIAKLLDKAGEGYDLVLGEFARKQHASYRRLGSRLVRAINHRIFGQEKDLVLSNFRLIRRDVVDRICAYRGPYPYVPGLCLMYSRRRANTLVEHHARAVGQSNYDWKRILKLVAAILFNYSSFPLRVVAGFGGLIALGSFLLGTYYLAEGLFSRSAVPGWTTLVVLLSFFNGIVMIMLAMLGEYVVRIINQISVADPYIINERVGPHE